jgi:protein disulfide-isomerase A1
MLNLKQEWPAVGIQDLQKNTKFPYSQSKKIKRSEIKSWVDDFITGNIEPSLKSEPIPDSNDGPVKVVVGKTYDSIVNDKEKDVFIEFYAPWLVFFLIFFL